MKKLEKKILNKVYMLETKRTITELVLRFGTIFITIILGCILLINIYQQLAYQQTLDLFQLFQEDTDTIRMYIGEVMRTFYEELPKFESMTVVMLGIAFIFMVLIFIHNFGKIKNKIQALKKYWFKH